VRDPAALAAGLLDLLADPKGRSAMGAAARQRFLDHFTADRMVEGTLRVIEELRT
jgi:glycosyltransferase involved in cell wall biosynthesis